MIHTSAAVPKGQIYLTKSVLQGTKPHLDEQGNYRSGAACQDEFAHPFM